MTDRLYRDKEWFTKEWNLSGQNSGEMARRTGFAERTLATWAIRHELREPGAPRTIPGSRNEPQLRHAKDKHVAVTGLEEPLQRFLLAELKSRSDYATLIELANMADASPKRVLEALDDLHARGFGVPSADAITSGEPVALEFEHRPLSEYGGLDHKLYFAGERIRFAICSDTHLGDKHTRLDALHAAYEKIADRGINKVLHPGDLTHGINIYRGQRRSLICHTYDEMVDYTIENYPDGTKLDIETLVIAGNHDIEGDFGKAGANPVRAVAAEREDITFLGNYSAYIEVAPGVKIHMLHPMGGGSYAKSYKPQKHAEGYEGGDKPAMTLFGHWHNMEMGLHRNIYMLNCGTFEGQNDLGIRLGLGQPAVGFWEIDMTVGDDGSIVEFWPCWRAFYNGRWVAARPRDDRRPG